MKIRTHASIIRRLARRAGRLLLRWGDNNELVAAERNGERWLVRERLAGYAKTSQGKPFIVLDVGANAGNYTQMVLELAKETACPVRIHAFDPAPVNMARLRERFADNNDVVLVNAAVGDVATSATLYGGGGGSCLASLVARQDLGVQLDDQQTVRVIRLDDYLEGAAVERVDLLKLDIEGFEFVAMLGLGEWLQPDRVEMIQFEYGGATMDAGVTLRQLCGLLTKAGYQVAKLFPQSLEVREYHVWMEHYTYANYVALSPLQTDGAARGSQIQR